MTDEPLLTPEGDCQGLLWCRRRDRDSEDWRGLYGWMCNLCARTNCVFRNTGRMNSIATDTLSRYDSYIAAIRSDPRLGEQWAGDDDELHRSFRIHW